MSISEKPLKRMSVTCWIVRKNHRFLKLERPNSFIGKNYGFRPYFKNAMAESLYTDMAVGVTTHEPGIYYSLPPCISVPGSSHPRPSVVIKDSVADLKREPLISVRKRPYDAHRPLTGLFLFPTGHQWLLDVSLADLTPAVQSAIARTGQFGNGPWRWTGFRSPAQRKTQSTPSGKHLQRTHRRLLKQMERLEAVFSE